MNEQPMNTVCRRLISQQRSGWKTMKGYHKGPVQVAVEVPALTSALTSSRYLFRLCFPIPWSLFPLFPLHLLWTFGPFLPRPALAKDMDLNSPTPFHTLASRSPTCTQRQAPICLEVRHSPGQCKVQCYS